MSAPELAIKVAAKLYECRDTARSLLGAHYAGDMAKWGKLIAALSKKRECTELAAAQELANEAGGMGAVFILAAYVELSEPSPTSQ
jgi:hypothetical protein